MTDPIGFVIYPNLDGEYNFPPEVRQALMQSQEMADRLSGSTEVGLIAALVGANKIASSSKGQAGGVATLDDGAKVPVEQIPDLSGLFAALVSGKISSGQIPDLSTIYASTIGTLTPEQFGAIGDGIVDDTVALNNALSASASTGKQLLGNPKAIYKVSQSGTKTFTTGTGSTVPGAPYCIQIPSGARADFRLAKISVSSSFNGIVLSNTNTALIGDTISIANVIVDGGGISTSRGYPMVWIWGLTKSTISGLTVTNTSYIAASISACTDSELKDLTVYNVRGQGIMLGNGLSDLNNRCRFSGLNAWDVSDFGTFSQPGNGFCIGATNSRIRDIYSRNCAGGIKYLKGCDNLHTIDAEFDGTVIVSETDHNTINCGIKVQGDDSSNKAGMVTFGSVRAKYCTGSGMYIRFVSRVKVGNYIGYKNARLGTNDEIDAGEFDELEFDSVLSNNAGLGGFTVTTNGGIYRIGRLTVTDYGDVTAANSYGLSPLQGKGWIGVFQAYDNRGIQVVGKAIHGINDVPLIVEDFRTNVGNRVDIRSTKMFLGRPILSSGNSPITGQVTLTNGATTTTISNNNAVSQAAGSGWAEPIIELTPMNASAQALGLIRTTIPSNFNIQLNHAAAVGTELFGYRVIGYTYRTTKPS